MSEKKDKKLPIKIKVLNQKSQEEENNQPEETEITSENSKPENTQKNSKSRKTVITTEISTRPKIVGQIPPWDDDDDDSQQDDKSKPPTITAEILPDEEKFNMTPRATGEIPPWDDEEEIKP